MVYQPKWVFVIFSVFLGLSLFVGSAPAQAARKENSATKTLKKLQKPASSSTTSSPRGGQKSDKSAGRSTASVLLDVSDRASSKGERKSEGFAFSAKAKSSLPGFKFDKQGARVGASFSSDSGKSKGSSHRSSSKASKGSSAPSTGHIFEEVEHSSGISASGHE